MGEAVTDDETHAQAVEPPDRSKVMIAVPTRGAIRYTTVLALQAIRDAAPGLPPIVYVQGGLTVCDVRNRIVKQFLESSCTNLVMCDDDIVPHVDILKLADHDVDIVAAPVMIARDEQIIPYPNVYAEFLPEAQRFRSASPRDQARYITEGELVKVAAVGTGCICIKRRVFESSAMKIPFKHRWGSDGQVTMTEDLTFCARAREVGYEVWADYGRFSEQFVTIPLRMIAERYERIFADKLAEFDAKSHLVQSPEWFATIDKRLNG